SAASPSRMPRAIRQRRPRVMRHNFRSKCTCGSGDFQHPCPARAHCANARFSTAVELYLTAMTDRIPPLASLRAFSAVARNGSFAGAASARHGSTSAVSHQIRGLEAALGASLLTRARNGAGDTRTAVTAEGEELLRAVEAALAQLATACEVVRERACGTR